MAARSGMADLITRLRGMTDAGTADYTITGVSATYWSDDQLQDVLDGHRRDIKREALMMSPDAVAGATPSTEYHDYSFCADDPEGTASGTTAWRVEDSVGSVVSASAYSVNARARQIRFTSDTLGTAYYLTYRSYDLERAAAEVWENKAAHVASRFDLKTDNHDMKRSQLRQGYLEMAALHRGRAKGQTKRLVRSDVNPFDRGGSAGW